MYLWEDTLKSSRKTPCQKLYPECLLMTSLPGKAPRMHVESRGLPSDSTCVIEAKPGKLYIKRHKYSIYQFKSWFTLQTSNYDVSIDLCVDSTSNNDAIQKVKRHDDLIQAHAMRWATFSRSTCNNAIKMRGY